MAQRIVGWQRSCALLDLLGLMMWIGGFTAILTMVVPAVFNTLEMETGGRLLRRVFDGYHTLTSGIVIVFTGTTFIRSWQARREPEWNSPPTRWEIGLVAVLAGVTCVIVWGLGPQAVRLQEAAFEAESRETKQAAFEAFFQLHMIVRALHLINVGVAVSLLVVKCRRWIQQP